MITQICITLTVCFVELQLAGCCAYGPGCIFPCRCETGGCDLVTGECLVGVCSKTYPNDTDFDLGWRGPGCRIGNIAYKKVTSQSGLYGGHISDRAVDGNKNPLLANGNSCAHPLTSADEQAWWMVDLGKNYIIKKIIIFFRIDASSSIDGRDTNFYIRIGNNTDISQQSLCKDYTGNRQAILQITCATDVRAGQYVSMQRRADGFQSHLIAICEFVVEGYEPIECDDKCAESCDDLTGCNKCEHGVKLPDCIDECDPGTWGENCQQQCGRCADSQPCDKINGECKTGCEIGFWDPKCSSPCGQCLNRGPCDQISSKCHDECEQWYLPSTCTVYIDEPTLAQANITTDVVSASSMMVSWEQYKSVKDGLDKYYIYKVVYEPTGKNTMSSFNVAHDSTTMYLSIELTGLTHNTEYEIKVVPYRVMGDTDSAGSSSRVIRTTSECLEPERPTLTVIDKGSAWQIQVKSLDELESGCDSFSSYYLYISSVDVDIQTILQHRSIWYERVIYVAYDTIYNGSTVWVVVTNNEGMVYASVKKKLIYHIRTTTVSSTFERNITAHPLQGENNEAATAKTILIIGSVLAVLGVVALVMGIVMALRNRKKCIPGNTSDAHQHKQSDHNTQIAAYENVIEIKERETNLVEHTPDYEDVQTKSKTYELLDLNDRESNSEPTVYQTIKS